MPNLTGRVGLGFSPLLMQAVRFFNSSPYKVYSVDVKSSSPKGLWLWSCFVNAPMFMQTFQFFIHQKMVGQK